MKSQISIEFLTGVSILLLIYIIVLGSFGSFTQSNVIAGERGKQMCYSTATTIESAAIGGSGFALNSTIASNIGNDYLVNITNSSLLSASWDTGIFACSITTQNIQQSMIYPGTLSVINLNETLYVASITTDENVYANGETIFINGSYFINDVNITVSTNSTPISGYPKLVSVTNGFFNDSFTANLTGIHTITAVDSVQKNLYSSRIINIR